MRQRKWVEVVLHSNLCVLNFDVCVLVYNVCILATFVHRNQNKGLSPVVTHACNTHTGSNVLSTGSVIPGGLIAMPVSQCQVLRI